ncbi:hypothetical protein ASE74_10090 [Pedobacter sp. Leaf216]|uniref:hypothetical protein n=1 Tax=Pedobacter sp. Leaf216 TaxID=1735684 RepID=UPI00070158CE|nr:hypothetical protein [Pedobacter sp. Leaf216]KQM65211.1 hypothetical protein ASE74_10090 [Pedobacter sp. Leaf216]
MSNFNVTPSGIRDVGFLLEDEAIEQIKMLCHQHLATFHQYPQEKFSGQGIVMCAGGIKYYTCAYVLVKHLRYIGCHLPIEIWHLGNEMSNEMINEIEQYGVKCRNFYDISPTQLSGVMLKPLAMVNSSFKEILFLDADNIPLKDPSFLFQSTEYTQNGAIFWPDYWLTSPENPIWKITECEEYQVPEQESGQILIDKSLCWKALNLALFFNERADIFHKMLYGDKDTFKFAWIFLQQSFHMIVKPVATCGYISDSDGFTGTTMVQHDFSGQPLFMHRNLLKWSVTRPGEKVWKIVRDFIPNAQEKGYELRYSKNGHFYINLTGDIADYSFEELYPQLEQKLLDILNEFRQKPSYARFLQYAHYLDERFDVYNKFTLEV